jgi:hypothetical protein
MELRHLGIKLALDFGLILLGMREQFINRQLAVFIQAEFLQALVQFFEIWGPAVPSGDVFHEADAFAFDGIGNDDVWLAASGLGFFEGLDHLLHVVAVDGEDFPSETAVFVFERLDVHYVFDPAVNLQAIAVDDANQVVELEMAGFHGGFPDLAFLLLAVAHDAEDPVILLVQLSGERDADGDAQALAERSGGDFHARQFEPVRVSLIGRVELAEERDVFFRAEAGEGQAKIETRRLVAGGPDDAIAVGPIGILGIVIGHAQVERGGDVHDGERATSVPGSCGAKGNQVVAAHQVGLLLQFVNRVRTQNFAGGRILDRHGVAPWRALRIGQDEKPRISLHFERSGACRRGL